MIKTSFVLVILIQFTQLIWCQSSSEIKIHHRSNYELIISVDSIIHTNYGLRYPLTYKVDIHSTNGSLRTFRKYRANDSWVLVNIKTQNDFFNDIEAARYDYSKRQAYLSLAFSPTSDSLYLKIINTSNSNVPIQFNEISKYYDNRDAAITTTADDWYKNTLNQFNKAIYMFRSRKLWFSGAVMTDSSWAMDSLAWKEVQKQLDSGYVEAVSHSRNHEHPPFNYESEIIGSKEDIIRNLRMPPLSSQNDKEYVYAYVHPFGDYNDEIDFVAGSANYLTTRGIAGSHYDFTNWNVNKNIYERMDLACEIGPLWGGITDLASLNSMFDWVVQNKKIYHFFIHPKVIEDYNLWNLLSQHLNYISNKKKVWYTAFGYLCLYHFLQESIITFNPPQIISSPTTSIELGQSLVDTIRADSYPPPKYFISQCPIGMVIDSITGRIQWTPVSLGSYQVEVRAKNIWGEDTLKYSLQVQGIVPTITSTASTVANTLQQYVYDVNASGVPVPKYSLIVKPLGMVIDSTSGIIYWSPSDSGSYNVTVRAYNEILPNAEQSFTINVELAIIPNITSIPDTIAIIAQQHVDTVKASGYPLPKYYLITKPVGMLIDSINGRTEWTPDSLGTYHIELRAKNIWGEETLQYKIKVQGVAPVITSTAISEGNTQQQYVYDVNAIGAPTPKYYLTAGPVGMAIDSIKGVIQWIPTDSGSYNITVKAANGILPAAEQNFIVNIELATEPYIISIPDSIAIINQQFTDTAKAGGYPIPKYFLITCPSGMIIDSISGRIEWTPDSLGIFQVELGAKNIWGEDTLKYNIEVQGIMPVITSVPDTIAIIGLEHLDTVKTNGYPTPKYHLNIAPSGMMIDSISGIIRWTPDSLGIFTVEVTTVNIVGSNTLRYSLATIKPLLSLKLLLEGLYDSVNTRMNTTLNSIIPTTSPYTEDPRNIDSIPLNVVDWVLIKLTTDAFIMPCYVKSILIDMYGFLVSDDGVKQSITLDSVFGDCYIVAKHRNSIETWSSGRVNFDLETIAYDFTTDSAEAFGSNMVKKGSKWCIYSGDVNQDGFVNSTDVMTINNYVFNYSLGYLSADLNGDGFVDLNDLVICDNNSYGSVHRITPETNILKVKSIEPHALGNK